MTYKGGVIGGVLLASLAAVSGASSQPLGTGYSERLVRLDDTDMPALIYRPDCRNPSLLLVFHGLNRNAESTRRSAQPLAEDFCLLLIVPLFDQETYPSWAYQPGGIVYRRRFQEPSRWTVQLAPQLVRWAQRQEGRAMPVYLLGHSAGAQFLSRVAAFAPTEARRIIIANPSTHVFASLEIDAPFGLGGVYREQEAEAQLRRYLAEPITILLGAEDTGEKDLNETPDAMAQGRTRLERGRNAYNAARREAQSRNWAFNWRLSIVPGVGHSARRMYRSREAAREFAH